MMKKNLIISMIAFIFCAMLFAEPPVGNPDDVLFDMYFVHTADLELAFIPKEITNLENPGVLETDFDLEFDSVMDLSASAFPIETSLGIYWNAYGESFTLDLEFSGGSRYQEGYMLTNIDNRDQGYNYRVKVTSATDSADEGELFADSIPGIPLPLAERTLRIVGKEGGSVDSSPEDGHIAGSATIALTLKLPDTVPDGQELPVAYAAGQYTGTINAILTIN